ncbi:hypothetical protein FRE64_07650 [Euhalothece natronophila Z-M001]|uniref:Uncharacterized protein n=1 Tax=Euhalothece natronophila Z-M001 TaxID=522448 RepID=A0A5B8NLD3_9CHRO|nr:hypothetical protein [Euhalothece natronophila]QDZ39826.1 hypothetical protein FRE64_07650 [Euhalothece natronophila Z-M001]
MAKLRKKKKGFGKQELREYKVKSFVSQLKRIIDNNDDNLPCFVAECRFLPELKKAVAILENTPKYNRYLYSGFYRPNDFKEVLSTGLWLNSPKKRLELKAKIETCEPHHVLIMLISPEAQKDLLKEEKAQNLKS